MTELKEKSVDQSKQLEALREEWADVTKQLLDLSDCDKKEDTFHNVALYFNSIVLKLWEFYGSFKFVADNDLL